MQVSVIMPLQISEASKGRTFLARRDCTLAYDSMEHSQLHFAHHNTASADLEGSLAVISAVLLLVNVVFPFAREYLV